MLEKNHFKRPSIFDILTLNSKYKTLSIIIGVIKRAKKLNLLKLILEEKSLNEQKGDILDQIRTLYDEDLRLQAEKDLAKNTVNTPSQDPERKHSQKASRKERVENISKINNLL